MSSSRKSWLNDWEEETEERNEAMYQLILERQKKEAEEKSINKILEQKTDTGKNLDNMRNYRSYNENIQKLLWDSQYLFSK